MVVIAVTAFIRLSVRGGCGFAIGIPVVTAIGSAIGISVRLAWLLTITITRIGPAIQQLNFVSDDFCGVVLNPARKILLLAGCLRVSAKEKS